MGNQTESKGMIDHKFTHDAEFWSVPTGTAKESEIDLFNRPMGGFDSVPEVVVFHDSRYEGIEKRTNLNNYMMGKDFDNKISSIIVVRGTWRFYRDIGYRGQYWDLEPGYYPVIGTADDTFSSFQCIKWD